MMHLVIQKVNTSGKLTISRAIARIANLNCEVSAMVIGIRECNLKAITKDQKPKFLTKTKSSKKWTRAKLILHNGSIRYTALGYICTSPLSLNFSTSAQKIGPLTKFEPWLELPRRPFKSIILRSLWIQNTRSKQALPLKTRTVVLAGIQKNWEDDPGNSFTRFPQC